MREIKALTSLRGIAAMWVMAHHLYIGSGSDLLDPLGIMAHGYLGVDFFFMLSGFILAAKYGVVFVEKQNARIFLNFVAARVGRLMPLNVIVTAVCVIAASALFGKSYSADQIVKEGLLVYQWPGVSDASVAINSPAWSISAELLVNMFFPALARLTLRSRVTAMATGASAAALCAWLEWQNGGTLNIHLANSSLPFLRCAAEFCVGMLLWRWRHGDMHLFRIIAVAAIISLCVGLTDLAVVGIMAGAIPAAADARESFNRILGGAPFHWFGKISFSFYLVQMPILRSVRAVVYGHGCAVEFSTTLFVISTFVLSIAAAAFCNKCLERPGQRLSKLIASHITG